MAGVATAVMASPSTGLPGAATMSRGSPEPRAAGTPEPNEGILGLAVGSTGKAILMPHTIALIGGTGPEGRGLATRFALAGHRVIIGSRDAARGEEASRELA